MSRSIVLSETSENQAERTRLSGVKGRPLPKDKDKDKELSPHKPSLDDLPRGIHICPGCRAVLVLLPQIAPGNSLAQNVVPKWVPVRNWISPK